MSLNVQYAFLEMHTPFLYWTELLRGEKENGEKDRSLANTAVARKKPYEPINVVTFPVIR